MHTREENAATYTANYNKNGRGNAEEGNCDGNANPSVPGGAIGGGVDMEYIHHGGWVQQRHALDAHDNFQHFLYEATGHGFVQIKMQIYHLPRVLGATAPCT